MRGVCTDALNMPAPPDQLGKLDSVRVEMRDDEAFYSYVESLAFVGIKRVYLYGPSTTNFKHILQNSPRPDMIILGNEPDGDGDSSWKMSYGRYKNFWRQNAKVAAKYASGVPLCAAGLINGAGFLEPIWDQLVPTPDMVNIHYPADEAAMISMRLYGTPVVVGEWCWNGATQEQMKSWEGSLERYTDHSFWFCWADPDMGLVGPTGYKKNNYRRLQKAIQV